MRAQIEKYKGKKVPAVTLHRIPCEELPEVKEESDDYDEESSEETSITTPEANKKPRPIKLGRSPMVTYIGQLYREREKKAASDKMDVGNKVTRPRTLPPPHYDHWNLDHVPLKCSQCDFKATHDAVKKHYKTQHPLIFPTAFDLEAKSKKKKYTVFLCPSSNCPFTTYWMEVINHHTKGHRFNRHELEGLIFKVFGDKTPGSAGRVSLILCATCRAVIVYRHFLYVEVL